MQALERREDAIGVLGVEADPVVLDRDDATVSVRLRPDADDGPYLRVVELECVADEVLQKLSHLRTVCSDDRELANLDLGAELADARFEIPNDLARQRRQVDRLELAPGARDASEGEEVVDQALHP